MPEFREADESVYRRIYIIKFDKKFTDEEVNKFDKSKIFTPDAINYFANIALREYLKIKNTWGSTVTYITQKTPQESLFPLTKAITPRTAVRSHLCLNI